MCIIALYNKEEGSGELVIYYDADVSPTTKYQFQSFVELHLKRRAIHNSVRRQDVIRCSKCDTEYTEQQVARRRERGFKSIKCLVCSSKISIGTVSPSSIVGVKSSIPIMEAAADHGRKTDAAVSVIEGKVATRDFDIFMAHNSLDKEIIKAISEQLKARGLNPWLDVEQVPPGRWFQDVIQAAIPGVKSAGIFIGQSGLGRWQLVELKAFIEECVRRELPVIPVLLPAVTEVPQELKFLKQLRWVQISKQPLDEAAFDNLTWPTCAHLIWPTRG